jgi:hypothetical protein
MRVPREFAGYFRFTVVRNPFTRMVSGWWFFCHDPQFSKFDPISFKDFILYTLGRSSLELRQRLSQIWFPSQVRKLGHNRIDCFLKFESLPDCLWALPFVKPGELTRRIVHTGDRRPIADYYKDEECYELVLEHSKDDFDRFGYSRKLP